MAKSGPRPTPTYLRLLRGNPSKRPLNKDEPQPSVSSALPPAPEFLTGYARAEWDRIARELYYLRLLTTVDIHSLGAYCQAYACWRIAIEKLTVMAERDPVMAALMVKARHGGVMQNPLFLTMRQAASDMVRYAAEFGLTPAARSRISLGLTEEDADGKFTGLLKY